MIQQFIKEGSIYSISTFATKGISLLLIPFYTAYFSPADYGVLDLLVVFSGIVNAFVSLQIGQATARYLADGKLSEIERKRIGSTGITALVGLYFIAFLLLIGISFFWENWTGSSYPITTYLFRLATINTVLHAISIQLFIHLRYRRKAKTHAILSFFQTIANMGFIFALVVYGKMGIDAIYWASILVVPFILMIQFYLIREDLSWKIDWTSLRKMLRYAIPLIPAAVAILIMEITDRLFIHHFLSVDALGIYGIGTKFPAAFGLFISSFSLALGPLVMQGYMHAETKEKLRQLLFNYIQWGGLLIFLLSLFSLETLSVFTSQAFLQGESVMPFMYFNYFVQGILIFSLGLSLNNQTRIISLICIGAAILNCVGNYWLIPTWGIVGAAFSTCISTTLLTLFHFGMSAHFYAFFSPKRLIIVLVFLFILIVCVFQFNQFQLNYMTRISWKTVISIVSIIGVVSIHSTQKRKRALKKIN
ncbi:MAG: hypothetical protein E6Q37_09450 [Crocinitomicaceae bacterium]|nr:MAG: hypothetical protein E6Q37_09450 [Crocinitomicaceae bacterium]